MAKRLDRHPWTWLVLGALLVSAANFRFGLGALAWVAPVPWLHYLRLTRGVGSRLAFVGVAALAWTAAVAKIVTDPMPLVLAFGFGLPLGVVLGLPFVAWAWARRRLTADLATLAFPTMMVAAEYLLYTAMPLGIWGAAANTQLEQLALLQLASVTGIHGVSFLVYLVAAVIERGLDGERKSLCRAALVTVATLVTVVALGQARLGRAADLGVDTRVVAAVGTDSDVGRHPELPDHDALAEVERGLVARTELAAASGAELVVWNEGATMVWPEHEEAWQQRLQALAARLEIDLVAAYVVPLEVEPLFYENKYIYITADGALHHTYVKHHPVPGEPAVAGESPMPLVMDAKGGSVGGAICYDYDFPSLALANGRNGVDLVALPSSDWRGIDPIHTQMAALRAIENGHSIVRSTRFGLSAGIDPWGRLRGWASHFESEERVLIVRLPRRGVTTVYATLGDWFPLLCFAGTLALVVVAVRRRPE